MTPRSGEELTELEARQEPRLVKALEMVAPGSAVREGIDNIVHARTGGLLVIGDPDELSFLFSGGIKLDIDYTPALRLLIQDGDVRKELIWEGAYNGTYGNTARDTWYSSSTSDLFYITGGNVNAGQTIAQWASQLTGATVSGFSVGVGSGATTGYHAFADNVTYSTTAGSTTYNFEAAGAVPEPASWAMMILGMGVVGFAMRSAKRRSDVKFDAKIKRIAAGAA